MLPTSIVTWKWPAPKGYRSHFTANSVNILRRMVARHFPHPHRFLCVTAETDGLDAAVEVIPPWDDFVHVVNPSGARNRPVIGGCARFTRTSARSSGRGSSRSIWTAWSWAT